MSVHDAKERLAGLDSESALVRVTALFDQISDDTDVHAAAALRDALEAAADFLAGDYDEGAKARLRELVTTRQRSLLAVADGNASHEKALTRQLMAAMLAGFDRD